jgi:Beta-lactamase enzyme family
MPASSRSRAERRPLPVRVRPCLARDRRTRVRLRAAIFALVLVCGAGHATSAPAAPWQPGVRAAIAYAHTRVGVVSFAVRTEHRAWGWRAQRRVPAASVLKAMLLVAYLDDPRVRRRTLNADDHRLIDPMIQRSDNTAATDVLAFVGAGGVYGVARRAGMRHFTLDPSIWGLSRIDAADQARFFLHIDREVVVRHRAAAMHLLATVTASQRWGIGQLRLPGWQLYFKGGWGSGSGAVEHQIVLLRHGPIRLSLAVLITSSPSHEYAKRTLRGLFSTLLRGVHQLIAPAAISRAATRALHRRGVVLHAQERRVDRAPPLHVSLSVDSSFRARPRS